jgi:hypothetical protein
MVNKMAISEVQAKIERDWRDVSVFPDLQLEIQPLYESWSKLLNAYPEWVKES